MIVDRAIAGRNVIFNFFAETRDRQITVPVRRIAYSTMKGRDLAILELTTSASELAARGVLALELAANEPARGEAIAVVGAPASFFDFSNWFLRRARCTVGERADLLEFIWHFHNTRRNDCADMVGGFSGSPVIEEASGQVMGVLNTTTYLAWSTGGDFDCYLGRPCEFDSSGQHALEDTSYSSPVTGLLACFTAQGTFDLTLAACPLDRGRQLTVTRRGRNQQPGGAWAATLTGDLPFYRWKAVVAGTGDCRDESGYSPVLRLSESPVISDKTPVAEERYLLCVVAGSTPTVDATWQPVRDATVTIVRIDETPPVVAPRYNVRDEDAFYRIALEFAPPELSSYSYKTGPPAETRCDVPGYSVYRRVPLVLARREGPYRVCLYAEDEAGNTSPALDFVVGAGPVILPGGVTSAFGTADSHFAPGQWISLYGLDLASATPRVRDAAGRLAQFAQLARTPTQINAQLPASLAIGPAQIVLGDHARPIELVEAAPSLHGASHRAPLAVVTFATGLARAQQLTARLGTLSLPVASIERTDMGLEVIRFTLPPDHGLTGTQFLQVTADGRSSNRVALVIQ